MLPAMLPAMRPALLPAALTQASRASRIVAAEKEKETAGKANPADAPRFGTIAAGELTAVVGDNSAQGEHRAGYNGVWSLRHRAHSRSLFVPALAGLNLEHLVTGASMADNAAFFEPRQAPMTFRAVSDTEAELHQPPTPKTAVESWTRFRVVAPDYLDMEFRCVPRQDVFDRGYLSLFWASYIHAPADKSLYFSGGLDNQKELWTQFCTPWHNDQSTVRHRRDSFEMTFADDGRPTLYKNLSKFRFDQPFFYGRFDELVWLVMFDHEEQIRLTHSPSGGGASAEFQTTNPAWDFQFVIQKPEAGREYGFRMRTMLRPRVSRSEILAEVRRWRS
jgi:hypothetical protein